MNDLLDLFHLVKSRVPLITIETRDEKDALLLITNLGTSLRLPVYGWNIIKGFSLLDRYGNINGDNRLEPTEVLYTIYEKYQSGISIIQQKQLYFR